MISRLIKLFSRFGHSKDIDVTIAMPSDISCVVRMLYECSLESGVSPSHDILATLTANATELIANQSILLAMKAGVPIGCVCASVVPPELWDNRITGSVYCLWVDGKHRDGHCAMVLGNAAFLMLKGMGVQVVRVGADDSTGLERVYRKVGFVPSKVIHILEVE